MRKLSRRDFDTYSDAGVFESFLKQYNFDVIGIHKESWGNPLGMNGIRYVVEYYEYQ